MPNRVDLHINNLNHTLNHNLIHNIIRCHTVGNL
jgi:hypothetical protein